MVGSCVCKLSPMADCIFCAIAANEAPSWRIYEDDRCVGFLDIEQATPGHALIIPRRHAEDLFALSEGETRDVAAAVRRVAVLLRDRLGAPGISVIQSNGATAWQDVFHSHVHVVPRYDRDELTAPWQPKVASSDDLNRIHRQLIHSA